MGKQPERIERLPRIYQLRATNTPTVLSLIGQLRDLIVNLGVGMAPLGSQILQMVTGFLKFTNSMMETNPIIGQMIGYLITFGGLFRALTPLTVAFQQLLNGKMQ
ncbi:hypothetical protein PO124_31590 [Bacillus licheniformis]|nr:hypothetical protein [Bacillus licheniformis]